VRLLPLTAAAQAACSVRLECVKSTLRLAHSDRNHDVSMVRAYTDRVKVPMTVLADFADRAIDAFALLEVHDQRFRYESASVVIAPAIVARDVRRFVSMVKTIGRATGLAMEPRAVGTESDEIGKRKIGIVPHGRSHLHPPAHAGGTDTNPSAKRAGASHLS